MLLLSFFSVCIHSPSGTSTKEALDNRISIMLSSLPNPLWPQCHQGSCTISYLTGGRGGEREGEDSVEQESASAVLSKLTKFIYDCQTAHQSRTC